MTHLDTITSIVPSTVKVRGFLDSPLWLDYPSFNSSFGGFPLETQKAYEYYGLTPSSAVVGAECAAKYQGEEWKCLFGQYRMPLLKTPYLLVAAQV